MKTSRPGFTLIELLVVVAMVAALATIHISAHAKAGRPTKIAQCASNLRQFTLASQILATENDGKFPDNGSGNWPWDVARSTLNSLDQYGVKQRTLYCPGTSPHFGDFEYGAFYNWTTAYGIIGYATTFPSSGTILVSTNVNFTLVPSAVPLGPTFSTPTPSTRVLLADATISATPIATAAGNFTAIQGAYAKPHTSPHLSGRIPLGGNVGMLDGHVEWRKFSNMLPRTTGSTPYFWW